MSSLDYRNKVNIIFPSKEVMMTKKMEKSLLMGLVLLIGTFIKIFQNTPQLPPGQRPSGPAAAAG